MVLHKEKLHLKPFGGSGFAAHLVSPLLRVALGDDGPQSFVTVMVDIDNMTVQNGCLRICPGPSTTGPHYDVIEPERDGNPDAAGRAGAIPKETADSLDFEDVLCVGGGVAVFGGWAPHRSAANQSAFPRWAVFLTYNPRREGAVHDWYYQRMEDIRNKWSVKVGRMPPSQTPSASPEEIEALSAIPRI